MDTIFTCNAEFGQTGNFSRWPNGLKTMDHENLDFKQNIHALGVNYMCYFLDRVGFTIHDVNRDPNHHFQIFAQKNDRAMLIAVRTACHPDVGTIDKTSQEELIKKSEHFRAVPHFAGLSLITKNVTDNQVDGMNKISEYNVIFNGIGVVHKPESLAANY